jgi:C-terminal processing protease CtpA/Prc
MKTLYISLLIFLVLNCSNSSKTPLSPKEYVDEAIKIIEEHSINNDSIDFQKIRRNIKPRLKGANSYEECYSVIQSIVMDLGDNHNFFLTKKEAEKWLSGDKPENINELITFSGKLLNNDIGYLKIKEFNIRDSISTQIYTDSLQQIIKSIDNKNLKGWILDLRENRGGNCWPMLAGLGPLLGNGICGYFIDNKNQKEAWFYRDGKSGKNNSTLVKTSNKPYVLLKDTNPIAVLTGSNTASSGEVVVTAFHNKNNTKSFGENTSGLSTSPSSFKLSDGAMIFITTAIYADRKGIAFGKKIKPDTVINFKYNMIDSVNDPVIDGAIDWIYKGLQK